VFGVQAEADEGIGSDHDDEGQDTHDAREPAHKWYFYNDRSVTEARPADARNAAAYVLFYRRRPAAN
jgi:ubiquitin C-terminal hydrolase